MSEDYRKVIFEFAKTASDEEFERVVGRFKCLCDGLEDFGKALQIFNPYLATPVEKTMVAADGLCPTCAKPCKQAKEGRLACKQYREYKEEFCSICDNFDEICMSAAPCEGGSMFFPREDPEDAIPV